MNTQFYHATKEKGYEKEMTIAVNVLDKDTFLDYIAMTLDEPDMQIEMEVGITRVNPKDNYIRKVGRQESSAKLSKQLFKMSAIHYVDGRCRAKLINDNMLISLQFCNAGAKVHLIDAIVYEDE